MKLGYGAFPVAIIVALGGCQIDPPKNTPTPLKAPDRAIVELSDIINNLKCDMFAFEDQNPYLTSLGRSLGGTLTLNIDRSHGVRPVSRSAFPSSAPSS